ncbi:MAG TPA: nucleotide exchange factor GrpE [Anaeromyxobacteraceae bacterium]|nr:nucleotide exchange factor GrpE [Anaeromyxobacteraceae bacterium]
MPGENEKGAFRADIPDDAVDEALRSVEKVAQGAEAEVPVEAAAEGPPGEDPAGERARLAAELELALRNGREALEKLEQEHERALRAAADLENYKKRAAREREEAQRFGNERLLKDLIPILDNLERALAVAPADDPLAKGVRLVLRGFEETLGRHGVRAFSALGQPFDPRLHEAVMQVPSADRPPGTVVAEHGRGFLLNDRLVRPAMVGVSVAPGRAEPPAGGAAPGAEAAASAGAGEGGNGAQGGETA